jgi:hypothetical protein
VQAAEVVLILIATVLSAIDLASGKSYETNSGIALTVIGFCMVILLGLVAHGIYRMHRWPRTPALLTQLFTGIVGIYLVQAPRYDWGIPAIALALAGFASLLNPTSIRLLSPGRPETAPGAPSGASGDHPEDAQHGGGESASPGGQSATADNQHATGQPATAGEGRAAGQPATAGGANGQPTTAGDRRVADQDAAKTARSAGARGNRPRRPSRRKRSVRQRH